MSNKKVYFKPQIEVYELDAKICLQQASEGTPPDPGVPPAAQQSSSSLQDNPFEENNLK